jgi:hypothetical protein
MLNLNNWVLGDDPERIFSVKSETIDVLKDAIKAKKKPVFDDIAAELLISWRWAWVVDALIWHIKVDDLKLCKVKIDLKKGQKLPKTIKVEGDFEELEPEDELWEVLTSISILSWDTLLVRAGFGDGRCTKWSSAAITRLKHTMSGSIGDEEKRLRLDERTFQWSALLVGELNTSS